MMRFINRLVRDERGESIISVIAGTILFLVASAAISSFSIVALATGAKAQGNTQLTAALTASVDEWKQTPWPDLAAELGEKAVTLKYQGVEFKAVQLVEYQAEDQSYQLTYAAARSVNPGQSLPDCTPALHAATPGCIAVSGTITATSEDIAPPTPAGVTILTNSVGADGAVVNLVNDPGFESGAFGAWAKGGNAKIVDVISPRAGGTKAAQLAAGDSVISNTTDVTQGDSLTYKAWVRQEGDTGAITLNRDLYSGDADAPDTVGTVKATTANKGKWLSITGTVEVTPGVSRTGITLQTAAGDQACDATCSWTVDDVSLVLTAHNIAPQPGIEETPTTWAPGSAQIATDSHAAGTSSLLVAGGAVTSAPMATKGQKQYSVSYWVRQAGTNTAAAATLQSSLVPTSTGTATPVLSTNLSGITAAWTKVSGTVTTSAGLSNASIRFQQNSADASSQIHVDDISITATPPVAATPAASNYIEVAQVDAATAGDTDFRLSFQYLGGATAPTDLRAAVFCVGHSATQPVSDTPLTSTTDANGNGNWLWARINIVSPLRLNGCGQPDIRVYSESGAAIQSDDIAELTLYKVLNLATFGQESSN